MSDDESNQAAVTLDDRIKELSMDDQTSIEPTDDDFDSVVQSFMNADLEKHGEESSSRSEGKLAIATFLKGVACYDIVPESTKVVVFDRNVPIRLSYYALVEHEIGAAPLWDPLSQNVCGIITTLDFIEILRYGHHTNSVAEILDNHSVASWRSLVKQLRESPTSAEVLVSSGVPAVEAANMAAQFDLVKRRNTAHEIPTSGLHIHPDKSLYEACKMLKDYFVHWIPMVDEECQVCLGVLTHLTVLQYLVTEFCEDRKIFEHPIRDLNIGTFASETKKINTATMDTKVHEVLDFLSINRISCVPILNKEGIPVAVYSRTNVIDLVSNNSVENSLHMSLGSLIFGADYENENQLNEIPERMQVHSCAITDTLQQVFIKFAEVRVHRLIYVDEADGSLQGIVSLSDLLSYFLD